MTDGHIVPVDVPVDVPVHAPRGRPVPPPFVGDQPSATNSRGSAHHPPPTGAPDRAGRANGVRRVALPPVRRLDGAGSTGRPRGAPTTPPPRPADGNESDARPTAFTPRVRADVPPAAGRTDPPGRTRPAGDATRQTDGGTRQADSGGSARGSGPRRPVDVRATSATRSIDGTRPTGAAHSAPGAPTPAGDRTPSRDRGSGGTRSTGDTRRPGGVPADDARQLSAQERARHIDATLTRLTAAHAGIVLDRTDDAPTHHDGRRHRSVVRLLAVVVVVAVVLAAGGGWLEQQWLASGMQTVAALDPTASAIVDPAAQLGAENILLVSTAGDTDSNTSRGAGSVAVAHVPAGGGPVVVVTLPAQLELDRPTCDRFDPTTDTYGPDIVPAATRTPLTTALTLGGPRCLTRAVQQLTGLAVTRYVGLDLDAIGTAVDAVSGVAVCVSRPVVDARLGPVAPDTGSRTLDGRAAADYVHASDVSSDPADGQGPVNRQQGVLAAVLGDTLSGSGLLDVSRVAAVRATLGPALVTDQAGPDQVLALARSLSRPDGEGVTFRAVPSTPDPAGSGVVPLAPDAKTLFDAVRTGAAPPAATAGATMPEPGTVHVDILNASNHAGQAARTGDILSGLGFRVGTVLNAGQPTPETLIRFSPDQANAAALLAASVPAATEVADPGAQGELQLVLGSSFDSVVKAPSTPAAPAPAPGPGPAVECA